MIVVGSLAVSLAVFTSPPPETVAVLVTLAGGVGGHVDRQRQRRIAAPAARTSLRVAVSVDEVHGPARAAHGRGREARRQACPTRLTVPLVGPAPELLTVIV